MAFKVVYNQKGCTAAGNCMKVQPALWTKGDDGKAILNGGALNVSTGCWELEIDAAAVESYRQSALVCPAFVIDILDNATGKSVLNIQPTAENDKNKVPVLRASYDSAKEWVMDPKGFFTIKPFPEEGVIRVRCYGGDYALKLVVEGKTAEEIYNTIVREGLLSLPQHAAYLGSELMKAEIAMRRNLPYVQDSSLDFP